MKINYSENKKPFFMKGKWKCANTYDANYKEAPNYPGIYFIVEIKYNFDNKYTANLVYIGSSSNLYNRYRTHNIIAKIKSNDNIHQFFFLELKTRYFDVENRFINLYKPLYNKRILNGN